MTPGKLGSLLGSLVSGIKEFKSGCRPKLEESKQTQTKVVTIYYRLKGNHTAGKL